MSVVLTLCRCDNCGRSDIEPAEIGKFHGETCGICNACLARMGETGSYRTTRGTNRTTPKPKRRKRVKP